MYVFDVTAVKVDAACRNTDENTLHVFATRGRTHSRGMLP